MILVLMGLGVILSDQNRHIFISIGSCLVLVLLSRFALWPCVTALCLATVGQLIGIKISSADPQMMMSSPSLAHETEKQRFRDFETVLVDNGSRDGSVELARRGLRLLRVSPEPCPTPSTVSRCR